MVPGVGCVWINDEELDYTHAEEQCAAKGLSLAVVRSNTALKTYLDTQFLDSKWSSKGAILLIRKQF